MDSQKAIEVLNSILDWNSHKFTSDEIQALDHAITQLQGESGNTSKNGCDCNTCGIISMGKCEGCVDDTGPFRIFRKWEPKPDTEKDINDIKMVKCKNKIADHFPDTEKGESEEFWNKPVPKNIRDEVIKQREKSCDNCGGYEDDIRCKKCDSDFSLWTPKEKDLLAMVEDCFYCAGDKDTIPRWINPPKLYSLLTHICKELKEQMR